MNYAKSLNTALQTAPAQTSLEADANWRTWLIKMGRGKAIILVTTFSILMSILIVTILTSVLDMWPHEKVVALVIAAIVPGVIAPTVSYFLMTLLCELEIAQSHLKRLAHRDSLTNIYNRHYFMDQLTRAFHRAERHSTPISLLMIDADKFKTINDTYGHVCGDEVLKVIANTCQQTLRPSDTLARYGGEEFVALLEDTTIEAATAIAERIRVKIERLPISLNPQVNIAVTLSIGIASAHNPNPSHMKALLERADAAMYGAKRSGRNKCVVDHALT